MPVDDEAGQRAEYVQTELEEVFRDWARKICWYGAVIFVLFFPLDYIGNPEHFRFFLTLRIAAGIALLGLGQLVRHSRGRVLRFWVMLGAIMSSSVIEIMIMHFEGADSPYFAGQILLGVVTLGFLPSSFVFHNVIVGTIQVVYALPILLWGEVAHPRDFITRNYLLFVILGTTVLISHIARRLLSEKIGLTWDLTRQERLLESLVIQRTRQLANAADEWRVTVDSTGDAIMLLDEEGKVIKANLASVLLSRKQFSELIGSSAAQMLEAAGLSPAGSPVEEVRQSGTRARAEFWSPPFRRWFQVTAEPVTPEAITGGGAVLTVRDITDVRLMQQAIQSAGKDWEETFDSIHEGITIHDQHFRVVRYNSAVQKLVGAGHSLVGLRCDKIFHGGGPVEDCPGRRAVASGRPVMSEFFEPHLGRYLEVTCLPRPHGGVIHVVRDITERQRNLAEIREAAVRRQFILERAPFGVFMVNADFVVEFANPAVLSITGYAREEFVGGCMRDLPSWAELGMKDYVPAALEGVPFRMGPESFHCAQGVRWIFGRFTGIPLEEEGKRKVLIFVEDITELKQAEEEQQRLNVLLLQAQKMESIGTLVSGISHDFNNVLLAVIGLSDAAMEMLPGDHPAHEYLTSVVGAAERGTDLVRQMLAFSRQQDLQIRLLDINELVQDVSRLLTHVLPRDVRLEVVPGEGLPEVMGDPGQIGQVLMNLVVNARDAMPGGGTLTIRTGATPVAERDPAHQGIAAGHYVTVEVCDTGTGMTPEVQSRIFDPFFTTKGPDRGTGLGLATAYGIITQHDGGIRVQSKPGQGSIFTVYLPAGGESPKATPPEELDRAVV